MSSADGELFNDTFVIESIDLHDAEGDGPKVLDKKFDKVSRIDAKSDNYETTLTLDVNMELYPLRANERVRLLLASKLGGDGADGTVEVDGYDPSRRLPDRADAFDYIMFGKIYKYAETKGKAVVYASFGGLLMALTGEPRTLGARAFNVDANLYLFLTKVEIDK
jgi:DNA-directed RNA polymerases I, II, and III subunit RPABC3